MRKPSAPARIGKKKADDPWAARHGYDYANLRLALDDRPAWMRAMGLRHVEVNGRDVVVRVPPRLRYSRKLGSFAVLPYDDDKKRAEDEATADERLAALKKLRGELLPTTPGEDHRPPRG